MIDNSNVARCQPAIEQSFLNEPGFPATLSHSRGLPTHGEETEQDTRRAQRRLRPEQAASGEARQEPEHNARPVQQRARACGPAEDQ